MTTSAPSEITNKGLWADARDYFHETMTSEIAADSIIAPEQIARTMGILEAAAVIEDMVNRAERAETPELVALLNVLLDQVISLSVYEGGAK